MCRSDQYQCQTGQCIEFQWLCDGEWDCADASDEEAVFLNQNWSAHNARLLNISLQVNQCRQRYSQSPFSNICNISVEFGCLRSGVSDPLNITLNRPCINLTSIGDSVEDCYNAYDEKNTFTAKSEVKGMWGFHFRCGNDHETYAHACAEQITKNCSDILCSKYRDNNGLCSSDKDFICFNDSQCKKNVRCDGKIDCFQGEDEYWCPSGSFQNLIQYRFSKTQFVRRKLFNISWIEYPKEFSMRATEQKASKSFIHAQNEPVAHQNYSYQCNRGITVLLSNSTRCLCPPSFYGSRCQFFSDRLTIITHLARKNLPTSMLNIALKVRAHLIFYSSMIIDQHEFHLLPVLETSNIIKHKFYLRYSRSKSMLQHKRDRYLNQTDIITDHPYAIHFILFYLQPNSPPQELGTWRYPIYFDYLPAHRLAVVLKYPNSLGNACRTNTCNNHSICLPIFNKNNSYYCSCRHGQHGVDCSLYESSCNTHCAPNALCRPNTVDRETNEIKAYCICPLCQFGSRCHLRYDQCDQNSCENNATCHSSFDPSGEKPFKCICSSEFHGSRCQYEKAYVHVQLNITTIPSARATVLQLYDILNSDLTLLIRHQKIYSSVPFNIAYQCPRTHAPLLGILKIYQHASHPQYFLVYALNQSRINITSSPQRCSPVTALLLSGTCHDVICKY
jgi:hypothetical protein